jgi:hypothetical protein
VWGSRGKLGRAPEGKGRKLEAFLIFREGIRSWAWWYIPVIPALVKLR